MKIKSFVFVSLTALATFRAHGQGTVIFDQQSSTGPVLEGLTFGLGSDQPMGQSFTPSLSTVGFFSLYLYSLAPPPVGGDAYVDVILHSGSITGPTIGTSESVLVPNGSVGAVSFIFDTPVSVTAGTQYFMQPVIVSGPNVVAAASSTSYNYGGGTAIFQGAPYVTDDLWFQEGIIVPEPSTWALLLLGAGAFARLRRH